MNNNYARMCDGAGVRPYMVSRHDGGIDCVWAEKLFIVDNHLEFWGCGIILAVYAMGSWTDVSAVNQKIVLNFFENIDNVLNPPDWAFEKATPTRV